MQIEDRAGEAEGHFVEERNGDPEVFLYGCLMVESHDNDQIRLFDQLSSQHSLNMSGRIGTVLRQSILHDRMDGLRLRDDTG